MRGKVFVPLVIWLALAEFSTSAPALNKSRKFRQTKDFYFGRTIPHGDYRIFQEPNTNYITKPVIENVPAIPQKHPGFIFETLPNPAFFESGVKPQQQARKLKKYRPVKPNFNFKSFPDPFMTKPITGNIILPTNKDHGVHFDSSRKPHKPSFETEASKQESQQHYHFEKPKKSGKKEVHYHQHTHVHEHDHHQEHKHKHLQDHKHDHKHGHDHKGQHKHEHGEKHQHKHHQWHNHDHVGNHKHSHHGQHKHDHHSQHDHGHHHNDHHEHDQQHDHKHDHHNEHNHDHEQKHLHHHGHGHKHYDHHGHSHEAFDEHSHHHKHQEHYH